MVAHGERDVFAQKYGHSFDQAVGSECVRLIPAEYRWMFDSQAVPA